MKLNDFDTLLLNHCKKIACNRNNSKNAFTIDFYQNFCPLVKSLFNQSNSLNNIYKITGFSIDTINKAAELNNYTYKDATKYNVLNAHKKSIEEQILLINNIKRPTAATFNLLNEYDQIVDNLVKHFATEKQMTIKQIAQTIKKAPETIRTPYEKYKINREKTSKKIATKQYNTCTPNAEDFKNYEWPMYYAAINAIRGINYGTSTVR